jgi:hypothetical protein
VLHDHIQGLRRQTRESTGCCGGAACSGGWVRHRRDSTAPTTGACPPPIMHPPPPPTWMAWWASSESCPFCRQCRAASGGQWHPQKQLLVKGNAATPPPSFASSCSVGQGRPRQGLRPTGSCPPPTCGPPTHHECLQAGDGDDINLADQHRQAAGARVPLQLNLDLKGRWKGGTGDRQVRGQVRRRLEVQLRARVT